MWAAVCGVDRLSTVGFEGRQNESGASSALTGLRLLSSGGAAFCSGLLVAGQPPADALLIPVTQDLIDDLAQACAQADALAKAVAEIERTGSDFVTRMERTWS